MPERMNVESFNLDHRTVAAPYVRLADTKKLPAGDVIEKYDVRFTQPNVAHLEMPVVHSLEHLFAEKSRNHSDRVIDFSPMGCQTGFYLILQGQWDYDDVLAPRRGHPRGRPRGRRGACGERGAVRLGCEPHPVRRAGGRAHVPRGAGLVVAGDRVTPGRSRTGPRRVRRRVRSTPSSSSRWPTRPRRSSRARRTSASPTGVGGAEHHRLTLGRATRAARAVRDRPGQRRLGRGRRDRSPSSPRVLVSAGSAGGLGVGVRVGDVVVGSSYVLADADARAFGYVLGQVPGMPASYPADARARRCCAAPRARTCGSTPG